MPLRFSVLPSARDGAGTVEVRGVVVMSPEGVVLVRHDVRNLRDVPLHLASLDAVVPVPARAEEVLDFTGLWASERRPQRARPGQGVWSRETRHGRPGHDDPDVWPGGLHPLVRSVVGRGMELGLWVEPEMVNPDSDLARAHPDWLLGGPGTPTWRNQRVLDLANADAYAHVRDQLVAVLDEYPVRYLKWDQNADLLAHGAHAQTLATYRLIDELRAFRPGLEIESCSSGGGRVDLGVLRRAGRVWVSDTNDPLDRQRIQRWTGVLVPPEHLGGHVGDRRAHITGRAASLGFRLATAFFGSAGIERNLTRSDAAERAVVAAWVAEHKARRELLHSGVVVHGDTPDGEPQVHGVVAPDGGAGVFAVVRLGDSSSALPAPVRLVGLDPERRYRVRVLPLGVVDGIDEATLKDVLPGAVADAPPPWLAAAALPEGAELPGRVLAEVGLANLLLQPEQALVLTADAV